MPLHLMGMWFLGGGVGAPRWIIHCGAPCVYNSINIKTILDISALIILLNLCYSVANMKKIRLENVVWKEGKYYVAQCLNVDVSSFGDTREEAIKNLDEAIELLLEDSKNAKISKIEKPELIISSISHA